MKVQNAKFPKDKFVKMRNLLKNLEDNNNLLIQVSYNNDGSDGYILSFAIDGDKSYYLYGCPLSKNNSYFNHPAWISSLSQPLLSGK